MIDFFKLQQELREHGLQVEIKLDGKSAYLDIYSPDHGIGEHSTGIVSVCAVLKSIPSVYRKFKVGYSPLEESDGVFEPPVVYPDKDGDDSESSSMFIK